MRGITMWVNFCPKHFLVFPKFWVQIGRGVAAVWVHKFQRMHNLKACINLLPPPFRVVSCSQLGEDWLISHEAHSTITKVDLPDK